MRSSHVFCVSDPINKASPELQEDLHDALHRSRSGLGGPIGHDRRASGWFPDVEPQDGDMFKSGGVVIL